MMSCVACRSPQEGVYVDYKPFAGWEVYLTLFKAKFGVVGNSNAPLHSEYSAPPLSVVSHSSYFMSPYHVVRVSSIYDGALWRSTSCVQAYSIV